MQKQVNDIFDKFINPTVYDIRNNQNQYIKEKEQFKQYIQNKPPPIIKKKKKDRTFLQRRIRYINVDSRDKDTLTNNNYTIDVSKENFTNVCRIEMVSSKFVNTNPDNEDIFITSLAIGGDFSCVNHNNKNVFGKIQIPSDEGDTVYNTYVGCQKVYYDNALVDILKKIDFQFRDYDGNLFNFGDGDPDHSFVLRITELIKKVRKTDVNTKIGVSLYEDDIYDTYI